MLPLNLIDCFLVKSMQFIWLNITSFTNAALHMHAEKFDLADGGSHNEICWPSESLSEKTCWIMGLDWAACVPFVWQGQRGWLPGSYSFHPLGVISFILRILLLFSCVSRFGW